MERVYAFGQNVIRFQGWSG